MNVESITVFKPNGPLNKVWLMWEVVKKFYRLADNAHMEEIAALEKQIDAQFAEGDLSEQTMRSAALLADQRHLADLSGSIFIRAAILHLQTAFVEFAVKEVFKLVLPDRVIPHRPRFMEDLINPLKEAGAFTDFPPEYLQDVFKTNVAYGFCRSLNGFERNRRYRYEALGRFSARRLSIGWQNDYD
jgi:hypothetical protein